MAVSEESEKLVVTIFDQLVIVCIGTYAEYIRWEDAMRLVAIIFGGALLTCLFRRIYRRKP
jgi:hypothetical protein